MATKTYKCSVETFNRLISPYLHGVYGKGVKNDGMPISIFYTPKDKAKLIDFNGRTIVTLDSCSFENENKCMQIENEVKVFVETNNIKILNTLDELIKEK